jgi:hypothetical protein
MSVASFDFFLSRPVFQTPNVNNPLSLRGTCRFKEFGAATDRWGDIPIDSAAVVKENIVVEGTKMISKVNNASYELSFFFASFAISFWWALRLTSFLHCLLCVAAVAAVAAVV